MEQIRKRGIPEIKASYLRTSKNRQVEYFYENIGFAMTNQTDHSKHYVLKTDHYMTKNINYIKIADGE